MDEDREVSNEETTMMTNNVKKVSKSPEIRRQFILNNIGIMDVLPISEDMGVHERTIYRDIDELKASGQWDIWIENELLRLHRKTTISDVTKYKEISKLRARLITQKTEVKTEGETTHKVGVEDELGTFITEYLPIVVELLLDEQVKITTTSPSESEGGLDMPQTDAETDEVSVVE